MSGAVVVTVPGLRLKNPLNGSWGHWRVSAGDRRRVRLAVASALLAQHPRARFALPAVVTITRVGPRALDDDNLAASAKSVRDQVATWFGAPDNDPAFTWRYAQARAGAGVYGVRIEIAAAGDGSEGGR